MSPNTQVALIALILFLVVATVSIFWPRLTGLRRSSMKPASGARPATLTLSRSAPPTGEAERQNWQLSPYLQPDRWPWTMLILRRIAGGGHVIARPGEHCAHHLAHSGFVVHHKDSDR